MLMLQCGPLKCVDSTRTTSRLALVFNQGLQDQFHLSLLLITTIASVDVTSLLGTPGDLHTDICRTFEREINACIGLSVD
jgi:hypothetical protein